MKPRLNLSQATTQLTRLVQSSEELDTDLRMFHAPSECWPLAFSQLDQRAHRIALDAGYAHVDELIDAIAARTTHKWVYTMGFGMFNTLNKEVLV